MGNGWIKLHRKIIDNPIVCKDAEYFAVWNYLLLNAIHENKRVLFKGSEIELLSGQLITDRKSIANFWGISDSKVERILKKLEIEQQIEQQKSNKNRLITIKNWHQYQDGEQQIEQQVNNNRTTNQEKEKEEKEKNQKKKNKENKEVYIKNEKNIKPPLPPFSASASNVSNLRSILNSHYHADTEYLKSHREVYELIREWMDYKDNKPPKTANHYGTVKGMCKLITMIVSHVKDYGLDVVKETIDNAMANNYQGITWDRIERKKKKVGNDDWMDEWVKE